jgi:hypothetical protein
MCEVVRVFLVASVLERELSHFPAFPVMSKFSTWAKSAFPVMSKFSTWASGLQTVCVVLAW